MAVPGSPTLFRAVHLVNAFVPIRSAAGKEILSRAVQLSKAFPPTVTAFGKIASVIPTQNAKA